MDLFTSSLDNMIQDFIKSKLLNNPKIFFNNNPEPTFIESWASYLLGMKEILGADPNLLLLYLK